MCKGSTNNMQENQEKERKNKKNKKNTFCYLLNLFGGDLS